MTFRLDHVIPHYGFMSMVNIPRYTISLPCQRTSCYQTEKYETTHKLEKNPNIDRQYHSFEVKYPALHTYSIIDLLIFGLCLTEVSGGLLKIDKVIQLYIFY